MCWIMNGRLVAAAVHLIVDYEAAEERAAEFSGFHSHIWLRGKLYVVISYCTLALKNG
jgi:hypothetical protein